MNSLTFTILLVPVFVLQIKLSLFNLNHLGYGVTVLSLWQPLEYGTVFPISFAVVRQSSHSNLYSRNISSNLLMNWINLYFSMLYFTSMLFVVLDCTLVDCISSLFPFSCWYILFVLYVPWAFCGFARFTSAHIIIMKYRKICLAPYELKAYSVISCRGRSPLSNYSKFEFFASFCSSPLRSIYTIIKLKSFHC